MSFLGMVSDDVREHAQRCSNGAQKVAELQDRLDAIVRGTTWTGQDRDRFIDQWSADIGPGLSITHDLLAHRADQLRQEAEEQDAVSDSGSTPELFGAPALLHGQSPTHGLFADIGDWLTERGREARDWFDDRVQDVKDWVSDRKDDLVDWLLEKAHERFGDPDRPDRPWAEIAAEELTEDLVEDGLLHHRTDVEVHGSRQVTDPQTPQDLGDLILDNDETRRTITTHPKHEYKAMDEAQIRVQTVTGADGVVRYIVHVPPTQGAPLRQNVELNGRDMKIPDPVRTLEGWDTQGQPFGWDNNLYAMAGKENAGANAVKAAMEEAGIPHGAEVAFVGHSQGGLVAAQLAGDPSFNGDTYTVTDVFSVGSPVQTYTPAQPGTDVLNVQHVEDAGRKGDFVPQLDLEGSSFQHRDGNPSEQVKDVHLGTPEPSDGFHPESDAHRAHESVQWNENFDEYDPHSGYYGSVEDNADHPDLAAKDERMRGRYYGEGVSVESDVVVDVSRRP